MAISSISSFANQLVGKGKDYDEFLKYWLKRYDDTDEYAPLPLIKDILAETNLSYSKMKRFVNKIYSDLISNNQEIDYSYKKTEYHFILRYYEDSAYFRVNELCHLPREGESITIPHFKTYLGADRFYVDVIDHEFVNDKQIVTFWLQSGDYNMYWRIRKDEAKMKNEIHWMEFIDLKEYELKKKLGFSSF